MPYCIYSDAIIDETQVNSEHIIPRALGGCDDFTIMVSEVKNAEANQKIDEKIKEDSLIKIRRIQHDFKGHRSGLPELIVKRATNAGNPVTWKYSAKGIEIFDHKKKQLLRGKQTTELDTKFDRAIRSKFVAKVALATGYFMFGDVFVDNADHNSLRTYVFTDDKGA